jgi:hypothetical protein
VALGDHRGHAKVDAKNPEAMGECDRDGFWYPLSSLIRQFEWRGAALVDTGFLVCKKCLDIPFEQNRVIILPTDPVPRVNPRPSHDVTAPWPIGTIGSPTTPWNQNYQQYVLGPPFQDTYVVGSPTPQNYTTDKLDVLAQVAQLSGISTPSTIVDRSINLATQNTTQTLMAANASRTYLLIYGPTQIINFFSEGTALLGASTNLPVAPGLAWYQDNNFDLAPCYTGAITAISALPNTPIWAWEAPGGVSTDFWDDGGVLVLFAVSGYPTSPIGLLPGNVWSNGLTVSVIPGIVPNPLATPLYFGTTFAAYLLAIGGGNLPLTNPGSTGQLWNNGGMISVS